MRRGPRGRTRPTAAGGHPRVRQAAQQLRPPLLRNGQEQAAGGLGVVEAVQHRLGKVPAVSTSGPANSRLR